MKMRKVKIGKVPVILPIVREAIEWCVNPWPTIRKLSEMQNAWNKSSKWMYTNCAKVNVRRKANRKSPCSQVDQIYRIARSIFR